MLHQLSISGALFTDTGILSSDIQLHAINKNKCVSIKFANFVINHIYCPITVKKKILQSCITSTLLYACETCGVTVISIESKQYTEKQ